MFLEFFKICGFDDYFFFDIVYVLLPILSPSGILIKCMLILLITFCMSFNLFIKRDHLIFFNYILDIFQVKNFLFI